jgi:hypothetical protein
MVRAGCSSFGILSKPFYRACMKEKTSQFLWQVIIAKGIHKTVDGLTLFGGTSTLSY